MHDQIPENITNGIKISVIDFLRNGDEKDKCKGEFVHIHTYFVLIYNLHVSRMSEVFYLFADILGTHRSV